jgi:hypothetical protein
VSELPPDVIQFLKSHVQSGVSYRLLLKYADEDTKLWARHYMAQIVLEDGKWISYDRDTHERLGEPINWKREDSQ